MESKNPTELIEKVQQEQQKRSELAADALQWFLDGNVQELFPRSDVVGKLCEELDITEKEANRAISDTVGDIVDPVQQVVSQSEKYVGIIEYSAYEDEGAYRYIDYDDVLGKRKRVVCAKCVADSDVDADVTHATEGEGSTPDNMPWSVLLNKVITHYENAHTTPPQTVTPGASLLNGTTISGNTAFHQGNENSISHDSISGVSASDHHIKTTSASDLTDVSPDSNSNAHHTKYTDSDAQSAVNTFSGSHNDLSNIGSNDHHTKYTDADAQGAVSTFSGSHNDLSNIGSNDHHSKTTSTSEIGDIITRNDDTALGRNAGNGQTNETAIGFRAARSNGGNQVTASGYKAARDNSGTQVTATGYKAAEANTGREVTATGYEAASDNGGSQPTATGYKAAFENTGNQVAATGYKAARNNSGTNVTATGYKAAEVNTKNDVTATGYLAAENNSGNRVTAIGYRAAESNNGDGVIAIGPFAANINSESDIMIISDKNANRRMELDLSNGDLAIQGSLNQNASM